VWQLRYQGTFQGSPVAMGRPRLGKFGTYTPPKSHKYLTGQVSALKATLTDPLEGPVKVCITFVHKRPQRLQRKSSPEGRIMKTTRPDIDNLVKMVLDIMTNSGMWKDDNQVTSLVAEDMFCSKNEEPHTQWSIYIKGETTQ
jgi:Holliday junction resolvase RusA-like endonuclease